MEGIHFVNADPDTLEKEVPLYEFDKQLHCLVLEALAIKIAL